MKLQKYKKKRNFSKTPEPSPKKKKGDFGHGLVFCIHKHAARRLHYDLRLECRGVLLSWAVPKRPSTSPAVKRLAVHVEDHPLSYRHFEGVIPEGNYGAGKVEIWDEGVYFVEGAETKREAEKQVAAGMRKGHLSFHLEGKKLKGDFALVKFKSEKDQWLLIKRRKIGVKKQRSPAA